MAEQKRAQSELKANKLLSQRSLPPIPQILNKGIQNKQTEQSKTAINKNKTAAKRMSEPEYMTLKQMSEERKTQTQPQTLYESFA